MKRIGFIYLLLLLTFFSVTSEASNISAVSYDVSEPTQTEIDIATSDTVSAKIFTIPGDNIRLVADVKASSIDIPNGVFKSGQYHYVGQGHIKQLRVAQHDKDTYRLVFDLQEGASLKQKDLSGSHLSLTVVGSSVPQSLKLQPTKKITKRRAYSGGPRYFSGRVPYPRQKPLKVYKDPRKYVVVIDPGHGGRDPGAIGVKGTYEKKVTLLAAKELKKLLDKTGRYKVMLTRSDDSYVEHDNRIRIARARNADLFISLHADSTASKTARGASVYTLADRSQKRSKGIVENQNWIMDVDLSVHTDPVGDILVDLAQRKTKSQSDVFAKYLLTEIAKSTPLVGNSHRRAGYYVLLAPDVPAVLLELGFLSNPTDEKLLKSSSHRSKVLKNVVTAIDRYFARQKS